MQARYLDLGWVRGVRFVGRFVQDSNPVTNVRLYYVFQGFTADGQSLVALFWPVRTSDLPDDVRKVSAESGPPAPGVTVIGATVTIRSAGRFTRPTCRLMVAAWLSSLLDEWPLPLL